MSHRVGTKGQIVIPKAVRDAVGLAVGAEVEFVRQDDEVVVRLARPGARAGRLAGRYAGSGMAARLLDDRRVEPR